MKIRQISLFLNIMKRIIPKLSYFTHFKRHGPHVSGHGNYSPFDENKDNNWLFPDINIIVEGLVPLLSLQDKTGHWYWQEDG